MRIFGLEIKQAAQTNVNVENVDKKNIWDIFRRTVKKPITLHRISQDIGRFKNAVLYAEEVSNPQRSELYRIYKNVVLDAHLTSVMEQRKNLTLQNKFIVKKPNGEVDEDKTKLINHKWFYDFICHSLDSIFYGHSLIQFGDIIKDQFTYVDCVPREYVKPEFGIVTPTYTDITGVPYYEKPWSDWVIPVGGNYDLGLLMKAAPLVIWKQAALGAWAEYQEIFGVPPRFYKTNTLDEKSRAYAEEVMSNFGSSLSAIIDINDEFEIKSLNNADAFRVFDEMINRVNSEISKLILNQTGTTDEKSYSGSANVHERILRMIEQKDMNFILHICNDKLVPFLKNLGIDLGNGNIIDCKEREPLEVEEKGKMVVELIRTGKYVADEKYLKDTFNIELEKSEEPEPMGDITQTLKNLYK
jgi:phage gp29-like protein